MEAYHDSPPVPDPDQKEFDDSIVLQRLDVLAGLLDQEGKKNDFKQFAEVISDMMVRKGFHTPPSILGQRNSELMLGRLMLVVTEVAEAAEAVRNEDVDNFWEEMADTLIRIFNSFGACGREPLEEMVKKMKVNANRPFRHGKVSAV